MTAIIITIVILIILIVWFKVYRRKKEYKIPTYYNTPTNYGNLDYNQVVRKSKHNTDMPNKVNAVDTMPFYENISNDVTNYTEPDNTGFSDGFGGGEFSGGGAGESWSDDSNNSND